MSANRTFVFVFVWLCTRRRAVRQEHTATHALDREGMTGPAAPTLAMGGWVEHHAPADRQQKL